MRKCIPGGNRWADALMALARAELPDDVAASVLVALNTFAPAPSFAALLVLRHSTVLLDFLLLPLIRQAPPPDQKGNAHSLWLRIRCSIFWCWTPSPVTMHYAYCTKMILLTGTSEYCLE